MALDVGLTKDDAVMSAPGSAEWWRKPFSVFQTNLQEIDALMDVEKALEFVEAHGADTWLINTGGIISFPAYQPIGPLRVDVPAGEAGGTGGSAG